MDYLLPRYRFHLSAKQKENPLTKNERRLVKILKTVPAQTIIGHCIHNTLAGAAAADVRQLISELKDQLRDAPENTSAFLGREAVELLQQL